MYGFIAFGLMMTIWPDIIFRGDYNAHSDSVILSLLGALSLLIVLGIFYPIKMLPLLLFEFLWKLIWVVGFALPMAIVDGLDTYASITSLKKAPNTYSLFAGVIYLLIIALGIFGQITVRNDMVNFSDAALTSANIIEGEFIWRLGIAGDIFMQVLDVPLMIIPYFLLSPVNKLLAVLLFHLT
jgi:hypothetical protein